MWRSRGAGTAAVVVALLGVRTAACAAFREAGGADDAATGDAMADDAPHADASSVCPAGLGLDPEAPWPMLGGCTTHAGRSPYRGPMASPQEIWSVQADGGVFQAANGAPVIGRDGTIYFGCENTEGGGLAIQPDGSVKWIAPIGNVSAAPLIHADGFIVFGAGNETFEVIALTPDAGLRWRRPVGQGVEVNTAPGVANDGTVYSGTQDGRLLALSKVNGNQLWGLSAGVPTAPAVAPDGRLYVAIDGGVKKLEPDGSIDWSAPTGTAQGAVVLGPGVVYASASGPPAATVYALEPADGRVRWLYDAGQGVELSTPALGDDGTIYVGGTDQQLHAIGPDGHRKWVFPTNGTACTPVVDGTGTIFLVGLSGTEVRLYAVAPTGAPIWEIPVAARVTTDCAAQPAIAADGTLYVLTSDAKLHAFR